jgi:glucose dehydrogenase
VIGRRSDGLLRCLVTAGTLTVAVSSVVGRTGEQDAWPSYGHDPGGSRYSPLTQITPTNVEG